jgi:predicted nucleic acid-binding Zn ribbon protein
MPNYVYKCNVCNRTDERFRKVENREKQEPCNAINTLSKEQLIKCPGVMIFQPMQKTSFTMNHLND